MSVSWKHSLACAIHDGAPCSCKEDAPGPLAQQIAQVREALRFDCDPISEAIGEGCGNCVGCEAYAALSAIERHVQDMETALGAVLDDVALVVDDHLSGCPEEREAAMPAFTRLMLVAYRDEENRHNLEGSIRAALSAAPTATHQETK